MGWIAFLFHLSMVRVVSLAFWVLKLSCLSGLVISGPTRGQDWMSVGCVGTGAIFLKITI